METTEKMLGRDSTLLPSETPEKRRQFSDLGRMDMVRAQIASFYLAAAREIPEPEQLEPLVEMAMVDWVRVSTADLQAVCSRARILAAERGGNFPMAMVATTADVLRAHRYISEVHHRTAYQREQKIKEDMVLAGRTLAEPTITEISSEGRSCFFDSLYAAAGLKRKKEEEKDQ